jgi:hypothetical protein
MNTAGAKRALAAIANINEANPAEPDAAGNVAAHAAEFKSAKNAMRRHPAAKEELCIAFRRAMNKFGSKHSRLLKSKQAKSQGVKLAQALRRVAELEGQLAAVRCEHLEYIMRFPPLLY